VTRRAIEFVGFIVVPRIAAFARALWFRLWRRRQLHLGLRLGNVQQLGRVGQVLLREEEHLGHPHSVQQHEQQLAVELVGWNRVTLAEQVDGFLVMVLRRSRHRITGQRGQHYSKMLQSGRKF